MALTGIEVAKVLFKAGVTAMESVEEDKEFSPGEVVALIEQVIKDLIAEYQD